MLYCSRVVLYVHHQPAKPASSKCNSDGFNEMCLISTFTIKFNTQDFLFSPGF